MNNSVYIKKSELVSIKTSPGKTWPVTEKRFTLSFPFIREIQTGTGQSAATIEFWISWYYPKYTLYFKRDSDMEDARQQIQAILERPDREYIDILSLGGTLEDPYEDKD